MKVFVNILLLVFGLVVKAQVPTAGLVGAWTFNGNANDVSGSANHGTVYGATLTTDRCGNPNSAYAFNGINQFIQTVSAGPTGTVSRSVSFWAKTNATYLMTLFAYGGSSGSLAYALQYNYNCPGVGIDVNDEALTRGNNCILNNGWHHVVAVFNSSTSIQHNNVDFYVDAVLLPTISCVITGSTQIINTTADNPISFGRIHDDNARFFMGSMDDIYLYNRVLNYAEIVQLYKACSIPVAGNTLVCTNASSSYSILPVSGALSYNWSLPNGWTGSSATNSIATNNMGTSGVVNVTVTGSCSYSVSSSLSVTVNKCNVLNESAETEIGLETGPNPCSNQLNLTIQGSGVIQVVDLLGQLLYEEFINNETIKINTSAWPQGLYLLKCTRTGGMIETRKIIRQ